LMCWVPPVVVDEALAAGGGAERRFRALPARLGVYFVLALCVFSQDSYLAVLRRVVAESQAGLAALGWTPPASTALTKLRRRLGAAPFEALFRALSGVSPARRASWSHAFGLLLVAWDGTTIDVADSADNAAAFGCPRDRKGRPGPWPQARLVALLTCGARQIIDAAFGPLGEGERVLAGRLAGQLRAGMLLLADRGFYSYALWQLAADTGAELLWRVKTNAPRLPVGARLPDGSYLSRLTDPADARRWRRNVARNRKRGHRPPKPRHLGGVTVRVVDAVITVTREDGAIRTEHYRLITTLLDHRSAPAEALVACYARRWAAEVGFRELKTYLRGPRVLRARDPECVRQELWAYLIAYQAIRLLICQTALRHDLDPNRISFTAALTTVQRTITTTPDQAVEHAEAVYADLARQLVTQHLTHRVCPRAVKKAFTQYPAKRATRQPASHKVGYLITIPTRPNAPPDAQPRAA
jgi:Insertion element 4 transposase N-terminal/Transposase DDE domain